MSLSIRSLRIEDLPAVLQIERDCFDHSAWTRRDFQRYKCLVAYRDESVVGFLVSHQIFGGTDREPPICEILNFAVSRQHRREGIGQALLQQQLAADQATYQLEVRESNLAAQALYEKFAFRKISRRPDYYSFPSEAALVMMRDAAPD